MKWIEMFGEWWLTSFIAILWVCLALIAVYVWTERMNMLVNSTVEERAAANEPSWKIWNEALIALIVGLNALPAGSNFSPPVAGVLTIGILAAVGLVLAYIRKLLGITGYSSTDEGIAHHE